MDKVVKDIHWLGDYLDADATAKGIGQGSEGARYAWATAAEIESLQSTSTALVEALKAAQRLIRDNQDAIRNNLQPGFERIQATEVMAQIRTALSDYKARKEL